MIFKFNLFFSSESPNGGRKTVTYRQLLSLPGALGVALTEVKGELGLVADGPELGFSLNALLAKYHAMLIGAALADYFPKDLPLRFRFRSDDLQEIVVSATNDICSVSSDSKRFVPSGDSILDMSGRRFPLVVCSAGACVIEDSEAAVELHAGEVALLSPAAYRLAQGQECVLLVFPKE